MKTLNRYAVSDQYGHCIKFNAKFPRKWLLNYFSRKHAERMFVTTSDGKDKHVGWVIAGYWLTVYHLSDLTN